MIVRCVGVGRVWACILLIARADILVCESCDKGINGIPKKKKEKRLKN